MVSNQQNWDLVRRIYPVSRETFERLELFVNRVEIWQKKTNLIAQSTLDDIWHRHICDSLQSIALKPDIRSWIDIGSGGGFPGLVIAAVMAEYSGSEVTLVESNQKKASFLRQTNRQMGATATIVAGRIEIAAQTIKTPEIVTARALADLSVLLNLTEPWLTNGAIGLFHKGREYSREIAESNGTWSYDLVEHKSRISADSVLLEIHNLKRKTD